MSKKLIRISGVAVDAPLIRHQIHPLQRPDASRFSLLSRASSTPQANLLLPMSGGRTKDSIGLVLKRLGSEKSFSGMTGVPRAAVDLI
jgi:hypothetical protein